MFIDQNQVLITEVDAAVQPLVAPDGGGLLILHPREEKE